MLERRTLLAAAVAAVCGACTAPPAQAVGSLVDLQIVERSRGDELHAYRHRGASYVAGRPGERYAVRLVNRTSGRVLVVLSVDGVNAISGDTAAVGQTGYVLAPYGSAEITGWRKSYAEAAAFYFTALPDSYAARTDRPGNVGVIGSAVFRERAEPPPVAWTPAPYSRNKDAQDMEQPRASQSFGEAAKRQSDSLARNAAPSAGAEARSAAPMAQAEGRLERDRASTREKLGTGHGEREYSPTEQTTFERATRQPAEVVQVRYDSYANLVAAGIIGQPYVSGRAQAFPGFAPDPR
ncbi:MAG: hypothetical protein M3Z16_10275 [Pseudomonadota bacterium]|nr:hypothetical protein [Pseudomonadota bacterium]